MKMKNKLAKLGLVGILAVSSANVSCTSPAISYEERNKLIQQTEIKPYAAFFEGLQPFSGTKMKEVADRIPGVLAYTTSGDGLSHMDMIRNANKYNQKVIIGGFSMGEVEARNLAEVCEKEGIGVDCLILIDGVNLGVIHRNVKKVVDIRGFDPPYIFRRNGRYTESNLENKNTVIKQYDVSGSHLDVPGNSRSIIESEIFESLNR